MAVTNPQSVFPFLVFEVSQDGLSSLLAVAVWSATGEERRGFSFRRSVFTKISTTEPFAQVNSASPKGVVKGELRKPNDSSWLLSSSGLNAAPEPKGLQLPAYHGSSVLSRQASPPLTS